MEKVNMKPGRKGYKVLFAENMVVMNYKFAAAAAVYDSPEYKILKQIREDLPGMRELVVTGHEQKKPRIDKRLTYENMERYMGTFDNAEELRTAFAIVRERSSAASSPYKYVSDWFKMQFPDYKKVPFMNQEGNSVIRVVEILNVDTYEKKFSKEANKAG